MEERTCICIVDYNGNFPYFKNMEYQVDVYPLFYCVYNNGGWSDYDFLTKEEFSMHFRLIF